MVGDAYRRDLAEAGPGVASENYRIRQNREQERRRQESVVAHLRSLVESGELAPALSRLGLDVQTALRLPRDCGAEQAALGAALFDTQACETLCFTVRPHHWGYDTHRVIFLALMTVFQKWKQGGGCPPDAITVGSELRARNLLGGIGAGDFKGAGYLTHLYDVCPSAANISAYIQPVLECYRMRQWFVMLEQARAAGMEPGAQSGPLLNGIKAAADSIEGPRPESDFRRFFDPQK